MPIGGRVGRMGGLLTRIFYILVRSVRVELI